MHISFMKYILLAFSFLGCTTGSRHTDSLQVSTEALDTIQTSPSKLIANPALFEIAFVKGTSARSNGLDFRLYGVTIGKLKVPSGHIVACDPLHIDEYGIPFTQAFPAGEFPVQLSIAKLEDVESIAFARINFSDETVARWELALLPGQSPLAINDEDIHGYGVDFGIGLFMDEEAKKALPLEKAAETNGELYKEMDKHYHKSWRYTILNFGNHNMAAFTTALGDGRYASYIGFDAAGKPCRLVTDFGLFEWKTK
jgi:hypothetical protein